MTTDRGLYGGRLLKRRPLRAGAEFLLGDDVLAAPVLQEGATRRDIYLPSGLWRDMADPARPQRRGPVWLRDYPAPLETLPYFVRVADPA